MEKMLITQALDERDLLRKKIMDKINKAKFVDSIKRNEEVVKELRLTKDEFKKRVEAEYQQIESYIDRYQKIEAAIVLSNAITKIKTSYGEYSVAEAIAIKRRLKDSEDNEEDFENYLYDTLSEQYDDINLLVERKNKELQDVANNMRLNILGKDGKNKDDRPLDVVDAYVKENTTEVVDPINIKKLIDELMERKDKLKRELDTAIKVSNATTFIEI
ncbi:MAG: hypothetical protein KBT35_06715 [Firmicutes bacterium]|nr:hypothetical protein [Candidatus Colivicinus equi]